MRNAAPGAATPVVSATVRPVDPGVNVVIDPGATSATSDDTYTVNFQAGGVNFSQTYTGLTQASDVLTNYRRATATGSDGLESAFYIFDFDQALTGALNYVTLAAYERQVGTDGAELAFLPIGRRSISVPSTGTALFRGATRGLFVSGAGELFGTTSEVSLTANFGAGTVSGQANRFRFQNSSGALVTRPEVLDFIFNGSLNGTTASFGANAVGSPISTNGLGITGRVEGQFFGSTTGGPTEVGLTYALGNPSTGPYMLGGGVMGKLP